MNNHLKVAFLGAGGIARCHAFSLSALPYYYEDIPTIDRVAVASRRKDSRESFARRFGFAYALSSEELFSRTDVDTVFILGPNDTHFLHLMNVINIPSLRRIYIEKPLCVGEDERRSIIEVSTKLASHVKVQVGFQFLNIAAIQRALSYWRAGVVGVPIHFQGRYLHSGYLDPKYRKKRISRLRPLPIDGASMDLGSHVLSLLVAFFGDSLEITQAYGSGRFRDVSPKSDLCSTVILREQCSGALGIVVASRISSGAGEVFEFELWGSKGAIRYTTQDPDCLQIFESGSKNSWERVECASDYSPLSVFPNRSVSPGWLRSLIDAHYQFIAGAKNDVIADLSHGIIVQKLLNQLVDKLLADENNWEAIE